MNIHPKIRNAALAGAIAAVAASAWAANDSMRSDASEPPAYSMAEERSTSMADTGIALSESTASTEIAVSESLSPNEFVVSSSEARPVLVADRSLERTAITVEERRLSADQRIQSEVMDKLASNTRLSGLIGVESHDAVVMLTGWTPTVGQARHAERDAKSVIGVRYVQNDIRPRVGGSV